MRRIAHVVAASAVLLASAAIADDSKHKDMTGMPFVRGAADMKFGPVPGLPTCTTASVAKGDPSKGAFVLVAKVKTGCTVPWHFHNADENVMLISGTARMEMKDAKAVTLGVGGYAFMPAKHVHQLVCTASCTLFVSSNTAFDIHYVDANGKEITPDAAMRLVKETATPSGT